MALNPLVKPLDERLKCGATGMGPQSQFEDIHPPAARLAAADDVLADVHARRQFHLTEPSVSPEGVEFLKEQLVLLTVERVSHPVSVAGATEQDQREAKIWENAIIQQSHAYKKPGERAEGRLSGTLMPPPFDCLALSRLSPVNAYVAWIERSDRSPDPAFPALGRWGKLSGTTWSANGSVSRSVDYLERLVRARSSPKLQRLRSTVVGREGP